jgi:hypothetical protein
MLRLLQENSVLVFCFALAGVVALAAYFAWRRYERGPTHPPYAAEDVRFIERFASGFSHKNLFTRLAGSHNALVVRVLKDALVIEPLAVFKWITPAGFNDLEHYVPKKDILGVESVPGITRNTLKIRFRAQDGRAHTVELALRKAEQFQIALNA